MEPRLKEFVSKNRLQKRSQKPRKIILGSIPSKDGFCSRRKNTSLRNHKPRRWKTDTERRDAYRRDMVIKDYVHFSEHEKDESLKTRGCKTDAERRDADSVQ